MSAAPTPWTIDQKALIHGLIRHCWVLCALESSEPADYQNTMMCAMSGFREDFNRIVRAAVAAGILTDTHPVAVEVLALAERDDST